jgi:hypothetical protein
MDIIDWLERNRYTIYYNLAAIKLLDELFRNIELTEEQELLRSAMAQPWPPFRHGLPNPLIRNHKDRRSKSDLSRFSADDDWTGGNIR